MENKLNSKQMNIIKKNSFVTRPYQIIFGMFLIMLSSCASTKQYQSFTHNTALPDTKGRIYVIRPSGMTGAAVQTSIYCDDVHIGKTGNNSYLCWDMPEGTYQIGTTQRTRLYGDGAVGSGSDEDVVVVKITPGKIYYIKQYPRFGGFSFKILSQSQGEDAVVRRKMPRVQYIE